MSKPFITITEEQWQRFIKSNAGVRAEIEDEPTDDYIKGYVKGFRSGLLDLLAFSDAAENDYFMSIEQLAKNLEDVSGKHFTYVNTDDYFNEKEKAQH